MRKMLKMLLLFAVTTVLFAVPAFAAEVTVGDVTYTYNGDTATNTAAITTLAIADSVTEPIDLVIPSKITDSESGTEYTVISIGYIPAAYADKVKSVTFEGDIPEIQGNLYEYVNSSNYQVITGTVLGVETNTANMGNVPTGMMSIPSFVTDNYNYDSNGDGTNDTYYVGENLVRVDTAYTGDLQVKDGTVSILASAMEGCTGLSAVTLPDSVEWIGMKAFTNSGVTSVNIPKGLLTEGSKQIQAFTFYGCDDLVEVVFPKGEETLSRVCHMAFTGCSSLTGFDFTRVDALDSSTFIKAFVEGTQIDLSHTSIADSSMIFSHSGIGKVTLGEGNTFIPFETFRNCKALTDVVGMEYVQNVSAWGFSGCTGITADILAESNVTSIAHRAFADTGMKVVTIPSSVTNIYGGAFAGNEQLETLNWKSEMSTTAPLFAILNDQAKGSYQSTPFSGPKAKDSWTEYTFPVTINIYAQSAGSSYTGFFSMQQYLEEVNYYCETATLPYQAFGFCPSLKSVTFASPELVTEIPSNAFMGCFSLHEFPFDQMTGLTTIGTNAFLLQPNGGVMTASRYESLSDAEKGYGLTSIDLSKCENLVNIGYAAFFNQYSAVSAHIPANANMLAESEYGKFHGTVSMTDLVVDCPVDDHIIAENFITMSNSPTSSYNDNLQTVTLNGEIITQTTDQTTDYVMFRSMGALKTVNITQATSIPDRCFMGCPVLEEVSMPNVTSVGEMAFMQCGIKSATLYAGVSYEPKAFFQCTALETVTAEEGVTQFSDYMFFGCTALEEVTAPDVATIGDFALSKTGLKEVVISKDVTYGSGVFSGCTALEKAVVEEGITELSDFMFEGTTALKEVALPSTLTTVNWGVFKQSLGSVIAVPESVTCIEDDAFRDSAFQIILEGSPQIETMHDEEGSVMSEETNIAAIGVESIIYYTDDQSKSAADLYIAQVAQEDAPTVKALLEAVPKLSVTGVPAMVEVGEALALEELQVTYNGTNLTSEQYELDYDVNDKTLGERTVTVKVTDTEIIPEGREGNTISAVDFAGETISGTLYSITDSNDVKTTFTVRVIGPVTECLKDAACPIAAYEDTIIDEWYHDGIHYMLKEGLMHGMDETTFAPDEATSRAMIVTILWYLDGNPVVDDAMSFEDVIDDAWYADAIRWAASTGIVVGYTDSVFAPDDDITREQMAAILWRYCKYKGYDVNSGENTDILSFNDASKIGDWAVAPMQWACSKNLIRGINSVMLDPQGSATRAQAANIIYRFCVSYEIEE